MKKFTKLVLSVWIVCSLFSCALESTNPGNIEQNKNQLYQVPGCGGQSLSKSIPGDTCFSYQFDTQLIVDFCVTGNCCPDSNRFNLSHEIINDTIMVAVQDTAANLCHCLCNYTIHAEFNDLALDHYIFQCRTDEGVILYNEDLWREDN